MAVRALLALLAVATVASGHRRLLQDDTSTNYNPTTITVDSSPYSVIATPITPQLPYSQAAFQCNVSGDSRIPSDATYPLTVKVPAGSSVQVLFANGFTTTQLDSGDGNGNGDSPGSAGGIVTPATGRKLLQDAQDGELIPGGPNNGLLEYVQLDSANSVPGFSVDNGQYGTTSISFSASSAAAGQTATFRGTLQTGQVVGGVPVVPFVPNKRLSPECQVNVNFVVA